MDNHEEHLSSHVYSVGTFEKALWVNQPEGLKRIWFWLTGRPKPILKTFLEIQQELNEHYNKHIESCYGVEIE